MDVEAVLVALAPIIAELIKVATAPAFDQEAERQLMLNATKAIYEFRAKQLLASP